MRVLSWNLFHGRTVPESGRLPFSEFATTLAGWGWDVALLQEVPPWWPPDLAEATGADQRAALTSRNFGRIMRRALAERWPDKIRSSQGGANAILVRGKTIEAHRAALVRCRPERRVIHAVRLAGGTWLANMHLTVPRDDPEQRDLRLAHRVAERWAGGAPLVFGGDVNQRRPEVPGYVHVARHHVDHIFVRGLTPVGEGRTLEHGHLSDHKPLWVEVAE
jgi:endonuclease/exonuclease/phosphatase family metal-dependent hydrolase